MTNVRNVQKIFMVSACCCFPISGAVTQRYRKGFLAMRFIKRTVAMVIQFVRGKIPTVETVSLHVTRNAYVSTAPVVRLKTVNS